MVTVLRGMVTPALFLRVAVPAAAPAVAPGAVLVSRDRRRRARVRPAGLGLGRLGGSSGPGLPVDRHHRRNRGDRGAQRWSGDRRCGLDNARRFVPHLAPWLRPYLAARLEPRFQPEARLRPYLVTPLSPWNGRDRVGRRNLAAPRCSESSTPALTRAPAHRPTRFGGLAPASTIALTAQHIFGARRQNDKNTDKPHPQRTPGLFVVNHGAPPLGDPPPIVRTHNIRVQ